MKDSMILCIAGFVVATLMILGVIERDLGPIILISASFITRAIENK